MGPEALDTTEIQRAKVVRKLGRARLFEAGTDRNATPESAWPSSEMRVRVRAYVRSCVRARALESADQR